VEFRILGPLEAWHDGLELELGAGRQRALLALLLLHADEPVSSEQLIDGLWGESPPASATKVLHNYVSQLRHALPAEAILTRDFGYLIRAAPTDADDFERLLEKARRQPPREAAATLRTALALWRGPPLADVAYDGWAQAEIARLEELRLAALKERIDADLNNGMAARLVPELEALVIEHPLHERLRAQLMLALYRSGRQSEALASFAEARHQLVDELGIEPGPELQDLQRKILAHDPELGPLPKRTTGRAARRKYGRWLGAAGVLLAAAALSGVGLLVFGGFRGSRVVVVPNSVAVIDPRTNRLVADIHVGNTPSRVVYGAGAAWVLNADDRTICRIDPNTDTATTFAAGPDPTDLAAAPGTLWVMNGYARQVLRVDPSTGAVDETIGLRPPGGDAGGFGYIAADTGALWLSWTNSTSAYGEQFAWRVDLRHRGAPRFLGTHAGGAIALGAGSAWIRGPTTLLRIDAQTLQQSQITIPMPEAFPPGNWGDVAVGFGSAWTSDTGNGALWRIDIPTEEPTRTIPVGIAPNGVAVGDQSVWVADSAGGTVSRIDPTSNKVVATITLGSVPRDLAYGDGLVWVSVD